MINRKKITIVFPCRNEEKIIEPILAKIPSFIDQKIVVNNRSNDQTSTVAKKMGAIVYHENRHVNDIGYGFAIQKGISKAKGDFIILMDGDKTYPISYVKKIINFMETNDLDFVSCKRFPLTNWKRMSLIRCLGGKALTVFTNLLFGTKIQDVLSGMWIFRKSIVPYLDLSPGDWNLSLSIKISAATSYKIKFFEYHIPYQDRKIGASKQNLVRTGISHLLFLIKLKYNLLIKPVYQSRKYTLASSS